MTEDNLTEYKSMFADFRAEWNKVDPEIRKAWSKQYGVDLERAMRFYWVEMPGEKGSYVYYSGPDSDVLQDLKVVVDSNGLRIEYVKGLRERMIAWDNWLDFWLWLPCLIVELTIALKKRILRCLKGR